MKYRVKPVIVEALLIHGNVSEIKEFIGENGENGYVYIEGSKTIVIIHTLQGTMQVTDDNYIIKVNDEFYPCHKDVFEETYELVESEDDISDMRKLPYSDTPKPLTVTMELSSADVLILEEISGEKIETEEQAINALKAAMAYAD